MRAPGAELAPLNPTEKPKRQPEGGSPALMAFCFVGLQLSYLTWGYVQEKVMTTEYTTGRFPSATFCVFSNRVLAILVALALTVYRHRTARVPAPLWAFAPCSLSNSLSSYGQYQSLRYVSFPLQTLSKSTKVIPVMLMGKLLNDKSYAWVAYAEAAVISLGVSLFSFSESTSKARDHETRGYGLLLLALYVAADSFTSQWQSRVYKSHPQVDQFQMMLAVNVWSAGLTLAALVFSSELVVSLDFLAASARAAAMPHAHALRVRSPQRPWVARPLTIFCRAPPSPQTPPPSGTMCSSRSPPPPASSSSTSPSASSAPSSSPS